MSADEVGVLIVSAILALGFWFRWYWTAWRVHPLASRAWERLPVYAALPASAAVLYVVLKRFAAEDVRHDARYLAFYLALGAAWVGVGTILLPLLGISPRDDVCERRNGAAGLVVAGAIVGLTLAFAGGNIGDGPGWWVVLFAAGLSTAALAVLWIVVEKASNAAERVTIERDESAGWRLAGFLIGAGLILGRAVAGDWKSAAGTVADFARQAWPVVLLTAAAIVADRLFRPSPERPRPPVFVAGVLPAGLYVAAAGLVLLALGWWK
jgi:hypothetical protein